MVCCVRCVMCGVWCVVWWGECGVVWWGVWCAVCVWGRGCLVWCVVCGMWLMVDITLYTTQHTTHHTSPTTPHTTLRHYSPHVLSTIAETHMRTCPVPDCHKVFPQRIRWSSTAMQSIHETATRGFRAQKLHHEVTQEPILVVGRQRWIPMCSTQWLCCSPQFAFQSSSSRRVR
jgi:hypothetical protein